MLVQAKKGGNIIPQKRAYKYSYFENNLKGCRNKYKALLCLRILSNMHIKSCTIKLTCANEYHVRLLFAKRTRNKTSEHNESGRTFNYGLQDPDTNVFLSPSTNVWLTRRVTRGAHLEEDRVSACWPRTSNCRRHLSRKNNGFVQILSNTHNPSISC